MGIVIGWDKDSHLTTKSNLSATFWILQVDMEILLHLRDVIVYNVHCYLELAVTWRKVQLPKTACVKTNVTCMIYLDSFI